MMQNQRIAAFKLCSVCGTTRTFRKEDDKLICNVCNSVPAVTTITKEQEQNVANSK